MKEDILYKLALGENLFEETAQITEGAADIMKKIQQENPKASKEDLIKKYRDAGITKEKQYKVEHQNDYKDVSKQQKDALLYTERQAADKKKNELDKKAELTGRLKDEEKDKESKVEVTPENSENNNNSGNDGQSNNSEGQNNNGSNNNGSNNNDSNNNTDTQNGGGNPLTNLESQLNNKDIKNYAEFADILTMFVDALKNVITA